ncbi:hypothetical protein CsSME_00010954 [Camellia sinensis var. sinensis]
MKSAEVEDIKKQMAELQAENSRLTGLVSSAEAERQKAAISLKDKYLRELVKLERKKDAEIKESAKEAGKQGFKKAEDAYAKQCNAAKELFFKCGWRAAVEKLGHDQQTEVFNPLAPTSYRIPLRSMQMPCSSSSLKAQILMKTLLLRILRLLVWTRQFGWRPRWKT